MALRRGPVLVSLMCLVAAVVAAAVLPSAAYPGAPWFEPSKVYDQNFPDPSIVVDGGVHYAFGTSTGGAYLPVMTSPDARTWTARPSSEERRVGTAGVSTGRSRWCPFT